MTSISRVRTLFACLSFVLLCVVSSAAQTGSISGTVSDQAGAVVTDAEVTATNAGTGLKRATTTSSSGTFSITDLPAGMYAGAVKKAGFRLFKVSDAQLSVGQVLAVNPKLEPGVVTEVVQVSGNALSDVDLDTSATTTSCLMAWTITTRLYREAWVGC